MGSWMGIKKKKKKYNLGKKELLTIFGIGASLLIISFGSLWYVSKKSAENNILKLNSMMGPKDSFLQGFSLKMKKENISCSGFITFDCEIKNPIIWAPSLGIDLFEADLLKIGTFSKNGFMIGNKMKFNATAKNLKISKTHPAIKDITEDAQKIRQDVFPLDLDLTFTTIIKNNSESKIYLKIGIDNKTSYSSVEGNLLNILESNLLDTEKKTPSRKIITILKFFKINIKNKNIDNLIYDFYSYYYTLAITDTDKKKVNNSFFGEEIAKKLTIKDLKSKMLEKLDIIRINKTTGEYFSMIKSFFEGKNKSIIIEGQNKDNFTINNMENINTLSKKHLKYLEHFNIQIKTGDNL